jgi:hypothetical protein
MVVVLGSITQFSRYTQIRMRSMALRETSTSPCNLVSALVVYKRFLLDIKQ